MHIPLAETLRPQKLEEVIGQDHLVGEQGPIRKLIEGQSLPSMVLWGPPGTGKTTLARIVTSYFDYTFTELSGVEFSIKKLSEIKKKQPTLGDPGDKPQVIFVDEIHRLNKSQQANFLPYVERGEWILIGATTENPSFEVISPLLSRSKVFVLNGLEEEHLHQLIKRVEGHWKKATGGMKLSKQAREYLVKSSNGDARYLINTLQSLAEMFHVQRPTLEQIKEAVGNMHLVYDKHGDQHYDTISALHKSMRGSDPDAAVYYLARMLEAGEDPVYIARRCLRFAAEDIGNADRGALITANAAFEAVQKIGMPECDVVLAQLVIYLARAKKSNEAYVAYAKAREDVRKHGNLPIPKKIRNAPTKLMKDQGYGKGYKYAHDYSAEELEGEEYLPEKLRSRKYTVD